MVIFSKKPVVFSLPDSSPFCCLLCHEAGVTCHLSEEFTVHPLTAEKFLSPFLTNMKPWKVPHGQGKWKHIALSKERIFLCVSYALCVLVSRELSPLKVACLTHTISLAPIGLWVDDPRSNSVQSVFAFSPAVRAVHHTVVLLGAPCYSFLQTALGCDAGALQ